MSLTFDETALLVSIYRKLEDPSNMSLPNPSMLWFFDNLSKRRIWLEEDISELQIDYEKAIIKWNEEDKDIPVEERKPIIVYIYTRGGDLDFANSLIDIIRISKTPVYTVNMGICMSAGALIFIAGHKRYVMPKSQILIHQGSINNVSGTTNQVFETIDNIKETEKQIKEYILTYTNIDAKTYNKNAKKEWFLTAEESIKYGVADEIIQDIDILFKN